MAVIVPTGAIAHFQRRMDQLEARLGALEDQLAALASVNRAPQPPLPIQVASGEVPAPLREPYTYNRDEKLAIIAELDRARPEDRQQIYQRHGINMGHYRYWHGLQRRGQL
jgi:hypothetical protein